MKLLQRLFYALWAVWAIIVVIHSLLIVSMQYALIFLAGGKAAERRAHKLSRAWAYYLCFLFGVRVKVYNREILKPGTAYVFISNHKSQLDIPVAAIATRHFFKFLAKEELTKIPLLGLIIKRLYLTVQRQSGKARVKSLEVMKNSLAQGVSVWLFPEGTRNKTGAPLANFFDGAFHVAAESGQPLAVCTFIGTAHCLPQDSFQFRPGVVKVYWEAVLEGTDSAELKAKALELMNARLLSIK